MFFKKITVVLLGVFWLGAALAQQDSLLLHPENLAEKDIYIPLEKVDKNMKLISGSRFPIAAADLPFSSHVITREEIRRNGYETLVDALKMVPGIRVSQPGSATEGETFLMRGLLGNTYAKILINDVPVKPSFVASMPIGAQLPIKEADRIEIIYGAGAALYGSDASAGVINIITRESDKPVFMQADLSVGSGVYTSVNVMFGGRLGRDKRIFKYFAYGSNVLFERRNIFNDIIDFQISSYTRSLADTAFLKYQNYSGDSFLPAITNTPHLSRKFGFNLKYKRFTLSAETMYRRDHSSLGLNPVAYSYRNPQTSTGEGILKFNLNIYKEKEKRNKKTDFTYIHYNVDNRSSILPVRNRLALMLFEASRAEAIQNGNDSTQQYYDRYYNKYLDGVRYMYGNSNEGRIEHIRNYRLFKYVTLTVGMNAKLVFGYPFTGLLGKPAIDINQQVFVGSSDFLYDTLVFPVSPHSSEQFETNTFYQVFYGGKKFNLTAGMNAAFTVSGFSDIVHSNLYNNRSPRLSGLYKITEDINIRTSWGTSFRAPNEYYQANSYIIDSRDRFKITRSFQPLKAEKTTSWESGIRWKRDDGNVGADLTWFLNSTENLIRYGRSEEYQGADSTGYFGQLGYSNLANTTLRYTGGQASFFFNLDVNDKPFTGGLLSYSWIKPKLTANDFEISNFNITPYRGRLLQFRESFRILKESTLIMDLIRYKNAGITAGTKPKNKFWTCDITWRYAFTERFDFYMKIINLFNKGYSGISPEADSADLLNYNPQTGAFIRLGMNYNIE